MVITPKNKHFLKISSVQFPISKCHNFFKNSICLNQNTHKVHTLQLIDMLMFAFDTFLNIDPAELAIINVFVCNLPLKDL